MGLVARLIFLTSEGVQELSPPAKTRLGWLQFRTCGWLCFGLDVRRTSDRLSRELKVRHLTLRETEVEAAAYVVSPPKATLIVYVPAFAGAVVLTEATPERFVVAVLVAPLRVKEIVRLESPVPADVLSVAESVIEAPWAALVEPV
jgi:hypothetical protein